MRRSAVNLSVAAFLGDINIVDTPTIEFGDWSLSAYKTSILIDTSEKQLFSWWVTDLLGQFIGLNLGNLTTDCHVSNMHADTFTPLPPRVEQKYGLERIGPYAWRMSPYYLEEQLADMVGRPGGFLLSKLVAHEKGLNHRAGISTNYRFRH